MKTKIKLYTRKNNNQNKRLVVVKEYYENKEIVFAKILFEM